MDALQFGPAIVAGTSMGGWVTQQIAIDYPEHVLGTVLMAAFGPFRENPAAAELGEAVATLEDPVDREFVHEFQASTTARPLPQATLDMFVDESLKVPAGVWKAAFDGFLEVDYSDGLPTIEAPTLIVWGDQDAYATRREQEMLVSSIPGARLLVYEGAGHAMHWEEPRRFAGDLTEFALEVGTRAAPPPPSEGYARAPAVAAEAGAERRAWAQVTRRPLSSSHSFSRTRAGRPTATASARRGRAGCRRARAGGCSSGCVRSGGARGGARCCPRRTGATGAAEVGAPRRAASA